MKALHVYHKSFTNCFLIYLKRNGDRHITYFCSPCKTQVLLCINKYNCFQTVFQNNLYSLLSYCTFHCIFNILFTLLSFTMFCQTVIGITHIMFKQRFKPSRNFLRSFTQKYLIPSYLKDKSTQEDLTKNYGKM